MTERSGGPGVDERSGKDGRRKREDTLIKDYLTEREEITSGPRFHVPPFTIKRIEGTRTIYYAPVGEDPEAQLEAMRGKAAEEQEEEREEEPSAGEPEPEAPAPARRVPEPAYAGRPDPHMPKAFAHLQARALEQTGEAPPAAGEPPSEPEPEAPAPPPEKAAAAPGPERPAPEPEEAAPPPANVIEAADERVAAALERVAGRARPGQAPAAAPGPSGAMRPVTFRKPFVKADTFPQRRTGLPPLPTRVSARELIARLRVVKEGVETRDEIARRMSRAAKGPAAVATGGPAGAEPEERAAVKAAAEEETVEEEAAEAVAGGVPALATPPGPAERLLEQKSEGGKLCPSCGMPISEKNSLLICTGCGRKNCSTCGRYDKSHMRSDVFYEYQFDWPLCLTCYEKAYTIQRMLGRASVCYGNGNFSYAMWYARNALQQDPDSRYATKINDLIEKIDKAGKAAGERDREWHFTRKQFSRHPVEDPRWRQ